MKRIPLVLLVLAAAGLGAAGERALGAAGRSAQGAAGAAAAASAGAPGAAVSAAARAAERSWQLTLAPAPSDLALALVRFHARAGAKVTRRTLQAAVAGPFGGDYLALASLRRRSDGARVALLLLVNRATALLDPAAVRLRMRSARALGKDTVAISADPFATDSSAAQARAASSSAGGAARRCGLTAPGTPLSAAALAAIGSRGTPLAGFTLAQAVAAAYDASCGLAYPAAFRQALEPPAPRCAPGAICCPANAMCAPPPVEPRPPGEPPPGCAPCEPRPGYACPLEASPGVCVAGRPLGYVR